jgi:Tol biopolymer transport system component
MKRYVRPSILLLSLAILASACVSPPGGADSQSPSAGQVETIVATTLQAMAPQAQASETATSLPEASGFELPQRLYFLGRDNQGLIQVFRMEQDGRTKTQLTSEPFNVTDYDVSLADGRIAYVVSNQLALVDADGSNRRLLVDGGSGEDLRGSYHPVFSPDGGTLVYAQNGLNLYTVATGASRLAIEDQMEDVGNGMLLPIETYSPEEYSPDGTKLLIALGHWEVAPSHAIYDPATGALVRYEETQEYIYCCSFHGGPVWAPDGSSFYGVASAHDFAYKSGEIWKVDASSGAITKLSTGSEGWLSLPKELFVAPDRQLYSFWGTYSMDAGYFNAPVLQLVRSGLDGATDRTVLREENFVLMNEALWAPDASFVIVAMALERNWQKGGVLELYPTDAQKDVVWLSAYGEKMKWGP